MAAQILAQDRYLVSSVPGVRESRVLGAFDGTRSPVTSTENYALKIAAGYFLYPRHENDSYYFLLRLKAAV